jgi:predicted dehydrogenase
MKEKRIVKIIQLGVGGFGHHWSKILKATPAAEVVGLVDISQEASAATCNEFGYESAICFSSLEAAMTAVDADMLLCVSPPLFHLEHITTATSGGLHVLCEKPMATTLKDCIEIMKVAQATDKLVAVSQQYRYRPAMRAMADLIKDGAIGRIGQIRLDFYKGIYFGVENFRRTMPYPILVDMSIHHFDLLRSITGLEAETIVGEAWNPPWSQNTGDTTAALTMTMNNGARFAYNASWAAQGDFSDWNGNWLIDGDKGSISYSQDKVTLTLTDDRYRVIEEREIVPEPLGMAEHSRLLLDFFNCIENGLSPETSIADNLRSIAMVFAAVDAVQTNTKVPVLSTEVAALLEGN